MSDPAEFLIHGMLIICFVGGVGFLARGIAEIASQMTRPRWLGVAIGIPVGLLAAALTVWLNSGGNSK